MQRKIFLISLIISILIAIGIIVFLKKIKKDFTISEQPRKKITIYTKKKEVLEEADNMNHSTNPDWWLNSGGIVIFQDNLVTTNIGHLEKDHRWRKLYRKTNSEDTGKGYQPQNLFRLVSKSKWQNVTQQAYFQIKEINLTDSPNRNESNGFFFFNRYLDGDNLYYTGLRVDGMAVIKKKYQGTYYTLADKKIFSLQEEYNKEENPTLLPIREWVGLRSEVKNSNKEEVEISMYIDKESNGQWSLILSTIDKGEIDDTPPITPPGHAGIRTDFMDVSIKNYTLIEK